MHLVVCIHKKETIQYEKHIKLKSRMVKRQRKYLLYKQLNFEW